MKYTNGEFVETLHSTLRKFEEVHGKKIVRKMGTPVHVQRSLETISTFNSSTFFFTHFTFRINQKTYLYWKVEVTWFRNEAQSRYVASVKHGRVYFSFVCRFFLFLFRCLASFVWGYLSEPGITS